MLNYLNQQEMRGAAISQADVAASFQAAAVEVLVAKTMQAAKAYGIHRIAMAGGVSANRALREAMVAGCEKHHYQFSAPELILCTDNAAMIGSAAYYQYLKGDFADLTLNAMPNLPLGSKE